MICYERKEEHTVQLSKLHPRSNFSLDVCPSLSQRSNCHPSGYLSTQSQDHVPFAVFSRRRPFPQWWLLHPIFNCLNKWPNCVHPTYSDPRSKQSEYLYGRVLFRKNLILTSNCPPKVLIRFRSVRLLWELLLCNLRYFCQSWKMVWPDLWRILVFDFQHYIMRRETTNPGLVSNS